MSHSPTEWVCFVYNGLKVCLTSRDGIKYVFVFKIQQSSYLYLPIAKVTYLYLLLVFHVFDSNTGQIHHFYLKSCEVVMSVNLMII